MELTGRFHTYFCGVSSLCHIGGACASIKEMVLTRTGVVIKIIDDDTFGDYTSEFQSVLRACEEHLDKFTCSFLPYGLLIKFANEGGDEGDDPEARSSDDTVVATVHDDTDETIEPFDVTFFLGAPVTTNPYLYLVSTWRSIPVSTWLVAPVYKPWMAIWKGNSPIFRGQQLTIVINHWN